MCGISAARRCLSEKYPSIKQRQQICCGALVTCFGPLGAKVSSPSQTCISLQRWWIDVTCPHLPCPRLVTWELFRSNVFAGDLRQDTIQTRRSPPTDGPNASCLRRAAFQGAQQMTALMTASLAPRTNATTGERRVIGRQNPSAARLQPRTTLAKCFFSVTALPIKGTLLRLTRSLFAVLYQARSTFLFLRFLHRSTT